MEFDNSFNKNSLFLVTGGAGFIGSNICEKLVEIGVKVRCFDNLSSGKKENIAHLECCDGFEFVLGDIRNFEECMKACEGVDFVCHNAALSSVAESMEKQREYESVNIGGMENMLNAAVKCGVKKFVYASSAAVYGDSDKRVAKEGEEGRTISVYARTKSRNEEQAEEYSEKFGLAVYGLRYFNVYGKRQRYDSPYSAVIPNFIGRLLRGEKAVINGDGLQTRDFVYVDDVVQANLRACLAKDCHSRKCFNVACGREISVLELYRTIEKVLEIEREPDFGPAAEGDIRFSCADISRIEKALGYRPEYSFERGIAACTKWYKENIL